MCHAYVKICNKLNIVNNYRNTKRREQELVVFFTDLPLGMVTQSQSPKYSHLAETTNKYCIYIVFIHVSDWQNAPKSSLVLAHAEFWYFLIRWKNLSLDCVKSSEKVKRHLIDWCVAALYILTFPIVLWSKLFLRQNKFEITFMQHHSIFYNTRDHAESSAFPD